MNTLRLNSKDQKILFVSDLHYCHGKPFIIGPRGYPTVQDAMKDTKEKWMQYIGPNDIVFNLGDIVVGAGQDTRAVLYELLALPCAMHYFIWGNHNAGVKELYAQALQDNGYPADVEVYPLKVKNYPFTFLGHRVKVVIDGKELIMDHYPILSWEDMKDSYMLHGHCHRNLKEDITVRRLDLSWDWKKRPVEWSEIRKELEKRVFVPIDHHGHTD
jgi:calcineurin-like phosphoesterase family protein